MASPIKGSDTESVLRKLLIAQGYTLSAVRKNGETGVDIAAIKGDEIIHIEVIGYKAAGPTRAKEFFQVFFRAISRIKDGARRIVIALPAAAEQGLPARARQYGESWLRLGKAFPELQIWLVDHANGNVRKTDWNEWATSA